MFKILNYLFILISLITYSILIAFAPKIIHEVSVCRPVGFVIDDRSPYDFFLQVWLHSVRGGEIEDFVVAQVDAVDCHILS